MRTAKAPLAHPKPIFSWKPPLRRSEYPSPPKHYPETPTTLSGPCKQFVKALSAEFRRVTSLRSTARKAIRLAWRVPSLWVVGVGVRVRASYGAEQQTLAAQYFAHPQNIPSLF